MTDDMVFRIAVLNEEIDALSVRRAECEDVGDDDAADRLTVLIEALTVGLAAVHNKEVM